MYESPMGAQAAMQDLLDAVEMVLDGAMISGMPFKLKTLTLDGLDGDGTVKVTYVTADGVKGEAEVDLSEGLPDDDAPPADAPPAADAAPLAVAQ